MFLRIELGTWSWSFSSRKRPQRHMDRKMFALRAPKDLGLRPPGSGDPFSNAHPVTLEAASPPSVARLGPPGPSRGRKVFCFCFLRRGPGLSKVAGGKVLTERSTPLGPGPVPNSFVSFGVSGVLRSKKVHVHVFGTFGSEGPHDTTFGHRGRVGEEPIS